MKKHGYTLLILIASIFQAQSFSAQGVDCASATMAIEGSNTADGPLDGGGAANICNTEAINSDWYFYTPAEDATITLESCLQGVDTRVSVYEGSCAALTCLASNDDACLLLEGGINEFASSITFNATGGETYLIEWDDRWSTDGFDWTLTESEIITEVPDCATLIFPADGAVDVVVDPANNNVVPFQWALATTGAPAFNVEFFIGGTADNLVNLGELGPVEAINVTNIQFATTYFWSVVPSNSVGSALDCPVFSFTTAAEDGDFDCLDLMLNIGDACDDGDTNTSIDEVTVDCICVGVPNAPNGTCADATPLVEGTFNDVQISGGSGAENICFLQLGINALWYSYTAEGTGSCTLNSSIDLDLPDTRVSVFSGDCGDLVCVAGDDDGGTAVTSLLTFDVVIGQSYFIQWDDIYNTDPFDFEFSCEVAGLDTDMDGVLDDDDNCPLDPNTDQSDIDVDGFGDVCDDDMDGDGIDNDDDCAPMDGDVYQGASCDDGDPITLNDTIDENCTCVGIPGESNVRLLEVNAETNQITFKNFGNADQDISDWRLCSNFNYTSSGIEGDVMINIVSGDYILSPDEEMTLQWTPATGFRLEGDDMGIYLSTGAFSDPNAMVDFMQYLTPGNGREDVAVAKGIWGVDDFVDGDNPYTFSGLGTDTGVTFWSGAIQNDFDQDGVPDIDDNCLETPNPDQSDIDFDGFGDLCDSDMDNDGVANANDCAPMDANVFQGATCDDGDPNTVMDVIQEDCTCAGVENEDMDGDGVLDGLDNCVEIPNADQADLDEDGAGDLCDNDIDGDGDFNDDDCDPMDATIFNGAPCDDGDALTENDSIQDDCSCMGIPLVADSDDDGVPDVEDNCADIPNPDQADLDEDGLGDLCDGDMDGDGIDNDDDNCPEISNEAQGNLDNDEFGDLCDDDIDGDGDLNGEDCNALDPFVFFGAPCDDGDPDTAGDSIQDDCSCEGVVGVEELNFAFNGLALYPNPTQNELFVRFILNQNEMTTFSVFDVSGKMVASEALDLKIGEINHSILTKDMNQGLYLLKINYGLNTITKRFTVVK